MNSPATATELPKRDIESELSMLATCLEELSHVTDQLEKRLQPALLPQPPSGLEKKGEAPPSPARSTVAQMVFDQTCKVRTLRRRISEFERIVQL
jgi:hypothetical protein